MSYAKISKPKNPIDEMYNLTTPELIKTIEELFDYTLVIRQEFLQQCLESPETSSQDLNDILTYISDFRFHLSKILTHMPYNLKQHIKK
jgi:hypothetical protein